ncbi:MAG: FKBP-type peptidyl-prolyl cis-trans isomerase [Ignavibacteriae bacterium]|nr:FKBP-type peptidyl-prolyl cis-trans isomerase [Ignavibacteriota bacterium]
MKILWLACASLILMACQSNTQQQVEIKSNKDSVSYSLGMDIGRNIKAQALDVDTKIIAQGLMDFFDSTKLLLKDEQAQQCLTTWRMALMQKQQAEAAVKGEENIKKGVEFLEENKKKEGVVTTASGLQYKVIKEGSGAKPTADKTVTVHYTGTLIDGTKFDSSVERGEPATFPLNGVIPGWTEGLQHMTVGSKYMLYIPAELGYGERGAGQSVPPNATLIFEVELLEIK